MEKENTERPEKREKREKRKKILLFYIVCSLLVISRNCFWGSVCTFTIIFKFKFAFPFRN